VVEFAQSISELLSQQGGWGLAGVMFFICRWIFNKREDDRAAHDEAMEARHLEFTTLLREAQDAMSSVVAVLNKCQGPKDD